MKRRMALEAFEDAPDGGGGSAGFWRALGWHWAELRAVSARDARVGEVLRAEVSHRVTVRWRPDGAPSRPTAKQRFREGGRVFDIVAVAEADDKARALTCWVTEGVAG